MYKLQIRMVSKDHKDLMSISIRQEFKTIDEINKYFKQYLYNWSDFYGIALIRGYVLDEFKREIFTTETYTRRSLQAVET